MSLNPLSTPDLCAHLDRLKDLCDRLEDTQRDPDAYRDLVQKIRMETEAFRALICGAPVDPPAFSTGIAASGDPRGN
jgi:hypothetical protein